MLKRKNSISDLGEKEEVVHFKSFEFERLCMQDDMCALSKGEKKYE